MICVVVVSLCNVWCDDMNYIKSVNVFESCLGTNKKRRAVSSIFVFGSREHKFGILGVCWYCKLDLQDTHRCLLVRRTIVTNCRVMKESQNR